MTKHGSYNNLNSLRICIQCHTYFITFFPVLSQHPFTRYMYIEAIQCKLSLYLKKAGLASRNIVHHQNQIYVVSALAQNIYCRLSRKGGGNWLLTIEKQWLLRELFSHSGGLPKGCMDGSSK